MALVSCKLLHGGLSERPMELVLKTSEQKCFVGSNPTASAIQNISYLADEPFQIFSVGARWCDL